MMKSSVKPNVSQQYNKKPSRTPESSSLLQPLQKRTVPLPRWITIRTSQIKSIFAVSKNEKEKCLYPLLYVIQKFDKALRLQIVRGIGSAGACLSDIRSWSAAARKPIKLVHSILLFTNFDDSSRKLIQRAFEILSRSFIDLHLVAYSDIVDQRITSTLAQSLYSVIKYVHIDSDSEHGPERVMDIFLSAGLRQSVRTHSLNHSLFQVILSDPEPYSHNCKAFLKFLAFGQIFWSSSNHAKKAMQKIFQKFPKFNHAADLAAKWLTKQPGLPERVTTKFVFRNLEFASLIQSATRMTRRRDISMKNQIAEVKVYIAKLKKRKQITINRSRELRNCDNSEEADAKDDSGSELKATGDHESPGESSAKQNQPGVNNTESDCDQVQKVAFSPKQDSDPEPAEICAVRPIHEWKEDGDEESSRKEDGIAMSLKTEDDMDTVVEELFVSKSALCDVTQSGGDEKLEVFSPNGNGVVVAENQITVSAGRVATVYCHHDLGKEDTDLGSCSEKEILNEEKDRGGEFCCHQTRDRNLSGTDVTRVTPSEMLVISEMQALVSGPESNPCRSSNIDSVEPEEMSKNKKEPDVKIPEAYSFTTFPEGEMGSGTFETKTLVHLEASSNANYGSSTASASIPSDAELRAEIHKKAAVIRLSRLEGEPVQTTEAEKANITGSSRKTRASKWRELADIQDSPAKRTRSQRQAES